MLPMPLLTVLAIEAVLLLAVIVLGALAIRRQGKINTRLSEDHAMLTAAVLSQTDESLAREYVALIESERPAA